MHFGINNEVRLCKRGAYISKNNDSTKTTRFILSASWILIIVFNVYLINGDGF